jgi:hypothetical protein
MTLEQLIQAFDSTASQCRAVLEKEIRLHRHSAARQDENLLGEKEALIAKLDKLVQELRMKSESVEESPYNLKEELNQVQQKLMQIMRLDRELEKLLLAKQAGNRSGRASSLNSGSRSTGPSPHAGLAARKYQRGGQPDD